MAWGFGRRPWTGRTQSGTAGIGTISKTGTILTKKLLKLHAETFALEGGLERQNPTGNSQILSYVGPRNM